MLGAPLGASASFGKSFVESLALRPMWPLKGGSGRGSTACCANASPQTHKTATDTIATICFRMLHASSSAYPGHAARLG